MLERVPRIIKVTERKENGSCREFIHRSVARNEILLESFMKVAKENRPSKTIDYDVFRKLSGNLWIDRPPEGWVYFAEEVGTAWDETPEVKRKELGIPKNYSSRRTTESALFSITGGSASIRRMALGRLVTKGKISYMHANILGLIGELKDAKGECEEINKKLAGLGVVAGSIELNGGPVSYVLDEDGVKIKISFPDFKNAKAAMQADFEEIAFETARRLCFGFSPVQ